MKHLILFFLILLGSSAFLPQAAKSQETPDQLSYYPGDYDAIYRFVAEHLTYPKVERRKGISGTVFIQFTVDSLGNTKNHTVYRGVSEGLDAEALRVSQMLKGFVPAKKANKPMESEFVLPIKFELKADASDNGKGKKKSKK